MRATATACTPRAGSSPKMPSVVTRAILDLLCKEHGSFAWLSFVPQSLYMSGGDLKAKALVNFVGGPKRSSQTLASRKPEPVKTGRWTRRTSVCRWSWPGFHHRCGGAPAKNGGSPAISSEKLMNQLVAPYHVSCYKVQSSGQQSTRCYFSSKTSEESPLSGYKIDVKCLSYLIAQEDICKF